MPRPIALAAALAGMTLAAPALAQSTPTLHIEADRATASIGDTITWTLTFSYPGIGDNTTFLQAYDLNLRASAQIAQASAFQTGLSLLVAPTPGTPMGADILGASGGQTELIDPANVVYAAPTMVGTFTTVAMQPGELRYDIEDGGLLGTPYFRLRSFCFCPVTWDGRPDVLSDTVTIIPAPATAALAAAGVLAAARRRTR